MTVVVAELRTVTRDFGFEPADLVTVGDSFTHRFRVEDPVDCTAADFTGFTPAFLILDAAGATVIAGTVAPPAGDATGEFVVNLTDANTTTVGAGNFAYSLRIDDGAGTAITLFCGQFRLTLCRADP